MEPVEAAHIASYNVVSNIHEGKLAVKVETEGTQEGDVCKVQVLDGGKVVAEGEGFETDKVVKFTREQDPTRLINYASGGNFERCSGDILDLHNYPGPDMYLYDPDYINVLGEYGGIGLPLEEHLWQTDRNWGYVQYKNGEEVLDVYEQYAEKLKELIDKGFAAAVYTQTTDVEGEVNGLMTYDRKVIKLDVERLAKINRGVIESL